MGAGLSEIAPGWWASQSRLYLTNSGIFISDGQTILIDPGLYPDEIQAIIEFILAQGRSFRAIVLTHSHWDHILGPEALPEAILITHASFEATALQSEAILRQALADWEKSAGIVRRKPFRIPRPDIAFDQRLSLQVGDQAITLQAAPGHAGDQIVAYDPGSATLWAGDMLSDVEIPLIQYSLAAYRKTLDDLAGLELRCLIPGHGAPTVNIKEISARLKCDRAYVGELSKRVGPAVDQGRSLAEIQALCESIPYHQDRDANRDSHHRNVEAAFLEAGGLDPAAHGWAFDS